MSRKSLGKTAGLLDRPVARIEQLGANQTIAWSADADALVVTPASANLPPMPVSSSRSRSSKFLLNKTLFRYAF
ncbi:hypothetical protein DB346_23035 [Verrucomicrobia bacterium LW23]|nr:hypothetical protein DB346_23035 [Verrucomicrobia bacterium LW23]